MPTSHVSSSQDATNCTRMVKYYSYKHGVHNARLGHLGGVAGARACSPKPSPAWILLHAGGRSHQR
eukprot:5097218-Pleurochrysis_carterae.AAC.1